MRQADHSRQERMGTHMTGGRLLHGGDYNPEQWLERPEILEEDIICVTLGVFSWSMLEPEEGRYDFAWLAERIDRLYENGIQVILATPSGAMPHWLTQKYPEVMQVQEDEKRNLPGLRHNFCYTSPVMREDPADGSGAVQAFRKASGRDPVAYFQ